MNNLMNSTDDDDEDLDIKGWLNRGEAILKDTGKKAVETTEDFMRDEFINLARIYYTGKYESKRKRNWTAKHARCKARNHYMRKQELNDLVKELKWPSLSVTMALSYYDRHHPPATLPTKDELIAFLDSWKSITHISDKEKEETDEARKQIKNELKLLLIKHNIAHMATTMVTYVIKAKQQVQSTEEALMLWMDYTYQKTKDKAISYTTDIKQTALAEYKSPRDMVSPNLTVFIQIEGLMYKLNELDSYKLIIGEPL